MTLLLSRGVPMLLGGDELGRTQRGNNNAYCQDNEISWFDWQHVDDDLLAFVRRVIAMRRAHPVLRRRRYLADPGYSVWFAPDGAAMSAPMWQDPTRHSVAVFVDGSVAPDHDRWGRAPAGPQPARPGQRGAGPRGVPNPRHVIRRSAGGPVAPGAGHLAARARACVHDPREGRRDRGGPRPQPARALVDVGPGAVMAGPGLLDRIRVQHRICRDERDDRSADALHRHAPYPVRLFAPQDDAAHDDVRRLAFLPSADPGCLGQTPAKPSRPSVRRARIDTAPKGLMDLAMASNNSRPMTPCSPPPSNVASSV